MAHGWAIAFAVRSAQLRGPLRITIADAAAKAGSRRKLVLNTTGCGLKPFLFGEEPRPDRAWVNSQLRSAGAATLHSSRCATLPATPH